MNRLRRALAAAILTLTVWSGVARVAKPTRTPPTTPRLRPTARSLTTRNPIHGLGKEMTVCDSQRPLMRRVWTYNACLAALAIPLAVLALVFDNPTADPPITLEPLVGWTLLTLLYVGAERFAVNLGKNGPHFGLGEIALVIGLALVPAAALIAAKVVGTFLVLAFYRKYSPARLAFNVVQLTITAAVASLVFDIADSTVPGALMAALVASSCAFAAVSGVMQLTGGRPPIRLWLEGLVAAGANTCLGLAALGHGGPVLAAVPAVSLFLAYRLVASERTALPSPT